VGDLRCNGNHDYAVYPVLDYQQVFSGPWRSRAEVIKKICTIKKKLKIIDKRNKFGFAQGVNVFYQ